MTVNGSALTLNELRITFALQQHFSFWKHSPLRFPRSLPLWSLYQVLGQRVKLILAGWDLRKKPAQRLRLDFSRILWLLTRSLDSQFLSWQRIGEDTLIWACCCTRRQYHKLYVVVHQHWFIYAIISGCQALFMALEYSKQ